MFEIILAVVVIWIILYYLNEISKKLDEAIEAIQLENRRVNHACIDTTPSDENIELRKMVDELKVDITKIRQDHNEKVFADLSKNIDHAETTEKLLSELTQKSPTFKKMY